jgi:hypothetical protein
MIPKIIHYCWLSGEPYPVKIERCIESWKKYLPEYQFKLWDTAAFDVDSMRWTKEAYQAGKYAFASDYIRFYALYHFGGIYLDTDVEVLKPFEPILECKSFMGFEYIAIPEAAVVGAMPGCSWIKNCLEYYNGKSFYDKNGKPWNLAVPVMMKDILRKKYSTPLSDTGKIQYFDELVLYPYRYFSPRDPYHNRINISSDTYTIHYSVGSWCGGNRSIINRYKHLLLRSIIGKQKYDEHLYQYHVKKLTDN